MVANKSINRCGEGEPLVLDEEEELLDEVPICMLTIEVIRKPILVIKERLLLVPELKEPAKGEAAWEKELITFKDCL